MKRHDDLIRTTLTLEPDVARLIEDEVHRARRPFKQVVNEALRRALASPPANLTTDAQLAAHAMENQVELCSNDTDFGRFPELRWVNSLAGGA